MSSLNAVITAWVRGTYAGTNDLASVVADFNSLPKTEITLTPGTVSVDIDQERHMLLVHALDVTDVPAAIDTIKRRYEAPLKEIFGC